MITEHSMRNHRRAGTTLAALTTILCLLNCNEIVFVAKGSIKLLDTRSKEVRTIREPSVSAESGKDSEQEGSTIKDPLLKQLLERVSTKGVKSIREYVPSPSGERLVFAGEFEETFDMGRHESDLWLVNRDGSGLQRLTRNHRSFEPAWSPSGKQIAFVNGDSISIIDIKTRVVRRVAGLQTNKSEDYHDRSAYEGPRWSPNGKAIAAQGGNGGTAWVTTVEARSGNKLLQSGSAVYRFAWNDDSELLFGYEGEDDVKVIFDWTAITSRARPSSGRRFLFKQNGKFGYFDSDGETVVKPQFSDAGQFSEGLAPVAVDGRWGYINKTGELTNIPKFDAALPFSRGRARVKVDLRWRVIDEQSLRDIGPAKSAIPTLIAALKDRHGAVRTYAAKALARMGPSALAPLTEALRDENESVRAAAARIIGKIGAKAEPAIPALVTALKGEDESASFNAAQALGQIGPSAIPSLIKALKDPRNYVRRHAARALDRWYIKDEDARDDYARRHRAPAPGRQDTTATVPAMIEALKDSDAVVRQSAAGTLGIIKPLTREAAEALLAVLKDPDSDTRSNAGGAIVSIIFSSWDSPFKQTAIAALIAALRGEDKLARDIAATLLDAVGPSIGPREKEAIPALVDAAKHLNRFTRINAFNRLARLGQEGRVALPAVIEAFKDQDAGVRKAAANALAAMGPEASAAVPALIEGLKSQAAAIRLISARALQNIGRAAKAAASALSEALSDSDPEVWRASLSALAAIGPGVEAAVPALIQALKDTDPPTRIAAIEVLKNIGYTDFRMKPVLEAAKPSLFAALKDENSEVRIAASSALLDIRPDAHAVVPMLIEALKDESPSLRANIAVLLGRQGIFAKAAVPAMNQLMKDRDHQVVIAALGAVADIGPEAKPARASLLGLLSHPNPEVRGGAASALASIRAKDEAVVTALIRLLKDKDVNVRAKAVETLTLSGPSPRAIPAFIAMLKDPEEHLRGDAEAALIEIGPMAVPALVRAVKLGSSKVRVIAARALARIQLDARSLLESGSGGSRDLFARVMRLNPVVDNKPIDSTLGEILTDYSRHRAGYNIEPHMWTSSSIRPHRWQIRFEYKDYQQRLFAAEWEYDAETNKLYPSLQVPVSAYSGLWEYDAKADKAYPRDSLKAPAFWVVVRPYGCKSGSAPPVDR